MSQQQRDPLWPPESRPGAGPGAAEWRIAPQGTYPPAAPGLPPDPDLPTYAPIAPTGPSGPSGPVAPAHAAGAMPPRQPATAPTPPDEAPTQALSTPPWRDPFFYGTADRPLPPPWRITAPPEPNPVEVAFADMAASLRQPLTRFTVGAIVLVALVIPCMAVVVGLGLSQNDWASGALAASIVVLIMGGLLLAFALLRRWLGYRSVRALLVAVLAAAALCLPGAAGLPLAASLHLPQARMAEAKGDWVTAVREYELAGRQPPASQDLARLYNEWGEQLLREGYDNLAAQEFNTVLTLYPQSGSQFSRALSHVPAVYASWIGHAESDAGLSEIVANLDAYRLASWCTADCAATVLDLEAHARFAYGTRLVAEKQYQPGIAQLEAVATTLAASAYTARAHEGAAAAYLVVGQGQRASERCQDAIPTYQTLATQYGDTPEGKQAQTDLRAPVSVAGVLLTLAPEQSLTMWLSRQASGGFSHDLSARVDANGLFTFKQVPPGQYTLTVGGWSLPETYFQSSAAASGSGTPTVEVQPLCPMNLGAGYPA